MARVVSFVLGQGPLLVGCGSGNCAGSRSAQPDSFGPAKTFSSCSNAQKQGLGAGVSTSARVGASRGAVAQREWLILKEQHAFSQLHPPHPHPPALL